MNLKLIIPIALIAIGAGFYGLSKNQPEPVELIEPVVKTEIPADKKIRIWRSKRDISPGERISRDDLKSELVEEHIANELGISENVAISHVKYMVAGQALLTEELVFQDSFVTPEQEEYIDLTIEKGKVPYAIKVDPESIVGGLINHGSLVDIIALSSIQQNLANEESVNGYKSVSISPVLVAVKVIKVQRPEVFEEIKGRSSSQDTSLILELSRKQLARLLVAKKIAQLEVHKSVGQDQADQLTANSGDVLPTYKAIREFRASDTSIR